MKRTPDAQLRTRSERRAVAVKDKPYSYRRHTFGTYQEASKVAGELNEFEREREVNKWQQ